MGVSSRYARSGALGTARSSTRTAYGRAAGWLGGAGQSEDEGQERLAVDLEPDALLVHRDRALVGGDHVAVGPLLRAGVFLESMGDLLHIRRQRGPLRGSSRWSRRRRCGQVSDLQVSDPSCQTEYGEAVEVVRGYRIVPR